MPVHAKPKVELNDRLFLLFCILLCAYAPQAQPSAQEDIDDELPHDDDMDLPPAVSVQLAHIYSPAGKEPYVAYDDGAYEGAVFRAPGNCGRRKLAVCYDDSGEPRYG